MTGCALDGTALTGIQAGTLATRWRGRALLKSPFDLALYMQTIDRMRPGAVIEIGTHEGGSAVWLADMMQAVGLAPCVASVDIAACDLVDSRVRLLRGDALDLATVLTPTVLAALPRPWLVIEDSAHRFETTLAVLRFFDAHLRPGERIVVEDGVVAYLPEPVYRTLEDGPGRALRAFLGEAGARYRIEREACDFYGHNVTWNPDGWLLRV